MELGAESGSADVISTPESSGTVLRIRGELDMSSRDSIEPVVIAAVVADRSVIIDLAELTFCDSSGIAMFIAADEKARTEGTTLTLRNALPQVQRVFELTGVDHIIAVTD